MAAHEVARAEMKRQKQMDLLTAQENIDSAWQFRAEEVEKREKNMKLIRPDYGGDDMYEEGIHRMDADAEGVGGVGLSTVTPSPSDVGGATGVGTGGGKAGAPSTGRSGSSAGLSGRSGSTAGSKPGAKKRPKAQAKQASFGGGKSKEEKRREEMAEKMALLRDRVQDAKRNVAWQKKLEAKKPAPYVPCDRLDFGTRFPIGISVDPDAYQGGPAGVRGPGKKKDNQIPATKRVQKPRIVERQGYPTIQQCQSDITEMQKRAEILTEEIRMWNDRRALSDRNCTEYENAISSMTATMAEDAGKKGDGTGGSDGRVGRGRRGADKDGGDDENRNNFMKSEAMQRVFHDEHIDTARDLSQNVRCIGLPMYDEAGREIKQVAKVIPFSLISGMAIDMPNVTGGGFDSPYSKRMQSSRSNSPRNSQKSSPSNSPKNSPKNAREDKNASFVNSNKYLRDEGKDKANNNKSNDNGNANNNNRFSNTGGGGDPSTQLNASAGAGGVDTNNISNNAPGSPMSKTVTWDSKIIGGGPIDTSKYSGTTPGSGPGLNNGMNQQNFNQSGQMQNSQNQMQNPSMQNSSMQNPNPQNNNPGIQNPNPNPLLNPISIKAPSAPPGPRKGEGKRPGGINTSVSAKSGGISTFTGKASQPSTTMDAKAGQPSTAGANSSAGTNPPGGGSAAINAILNRGTQNQGGNQSANQAANQEGQHRANLNSNNPAMNSRIVTRHTQNLLEQLSLPPK